MAAVRRGDDRAFELLFSRYKRRITAYVTGLVGDHARAEDITQDVFISALRRIRETQRSIAFRPWIYEIAKNACIDEFRRARRAAEVSFEEGDASTLVAPTVFVHAPAPHAAIESKQRLDDLCGAFGGLSEKHHRALVLRELEGLSYREIGERLGMTRAMVESTLFRARRRLSEEYEELASGRRCARVQSLIDAGEERPLTSLGVRERRQVTRHLAHCEPCHRLARVGGVDESLLTPRRGIARVAALFPFPLLRWRRAASRDDAVAQSGSHSAAVVQSLQNVTQLVDPGGPSVALGRAAAAAAAIALAGAGGGIVANVGNTPPGASVPPVAAARLPVLSMTKILVAAKSPSLPAAAGYRPAWAGATPTASAPGQPAANAPGSRAATATVGPAPGHSSGGTGPANGSPAPGSEPTRPPDGPAAPGVPAASGAGAGPGAGAVAVPNVSSPGPSSSPSTPQVPPPPSGPPSEGGAQVPSGPPASVQGAQVPTPSTPSPVQSTVQTAPAAVTQTVSQVQQSAPTPPAVSPPPGA